MDAAFQTFDGIPPFSASQLPSFQDAKVAVWAEYVNTCAQCIYQAQIIDAHAADSVRVGSENSAVKPTLQLWELSEGTGLKPSIGSRDLMTVLTFGGLKG